jgi:Protein of unknown function (DUF3592)
MILSSRDSPAADLVIFGLALVAGGFTFVERRWKFITQWLNGKQGRDWPTVNAVIDVVSVVVQTEQSRYGERIIGYQATLTYFYRNPELQMGDFCRMFDTEGEATEWANSCKGRNVLVHVSPSDPAKSALIEADLDAMIPAAPRVG